MASHSRVYALLETLRTAQLWLATAAFVILIGVTIADVFLRYLFNSPVRGSYDLVEFMLVVFVFHGMASAFLQRKNIVIDVIDTFANPRLVVILIRIADLLAVFMLALLAYAMIKPAMQAYGYGDRKLELQLPIYIMWIVALSGMAGSILCAIGRLFLPAELGADGPPEGSPE